MFIKETVPLNQVFDKLKENLNAAGWTETTVIQAFHPVMTANNAPTPYVAAASSYAAANDAWKAFTADNGTANYWLALNMTYPSWLRLDVSAAAPKVVASYAVYPPASNVLLAAPKNWTLEGTNDTTFASWTTLDTQVNQTNWVTGERRVFSVNNTTAYRYYRIVCTANNGHATYSAGIGKLELMESSTAALAAGNYCQVMTSQGTRGTDSIAIYLQRQNIKDPSGNWFHIGMIENFNPVGSFTSQSAHPYYTAYSASATATPGTVPLTYYLDVTLDRFIFATVMDFSAPTPANNFVYAGLINRYSSDQGNDSVVIGFGMQNPAGAAKVSMMRNKALTWFAPYDTKSIPNAYSPSVWGDQILVSPVFLEGVNEGIRGELDGVFTCRTENLINEDEIVVGSVTYKVIYATAWVANTLPYATLLLKLPTP